MSGESLKTEKYYFIRIPKTASTFIRDRLKKNNLLINADSYTWHTYGYGETDNFLNDPNYEKEKSFTVVRNPFDLLSSYYCCNWATVRQHQKVKSFEEFIKNYCLCKPSDWHYPELNKNLFGQIFNEKGESLIKYVLFYENLFDNLYELTGKEIKDKDPIGASSNKDMLFTERYTEEMRELVEKKCKWELETFGYI